MIYLLIMYTIKFIIAHLFFFYFGDGLRTLVNKRIFLVVENIWLIIII